MKYSEIGGYAVFCLKIACTQSGLSLLFAPFSEEKQRNFMPTKKVVNKTRKAVSKRFKVTASGKVKRNRQGKRHLLSSKSPKRRRRLGSATYVEKDDMRRITESLPFSH